MKLARLLVAALLALPLPAPAQYADYLNPALEYDTVWLANASTLLSMARQNLALEMSATGLEWALSESARRPASPPARPERGAERGSAPIERTDFRPERSRSLIEQYAAFADDAEGRAFLRELGAGLFASLESDPGFRRDNLSHGIALVLGLAIATEKGRELEARESEALLAAVHAFLLDAGVMERLSRAEITAAYDTCVVFAAMIATLNLDVRTNGSQASERAARAMARAALEAFGL